MIWSIMGNARLILLSLIVILSLSLGGAIVACNGGEGKTSVIAFHSDRDGNFEIYVMDADVSNVVRLTNNSYQDTYPDWSPDGSKITFVSK